MAGKVPSDLLYDSEAALRLIDTALDELRGESFGASETRGQVRAPGARSDRIVGLGSVTRVLTHAYADVMSALGSLRETRSILEHVAADRLKSTNDKLLEVSSATEVAATDILDGVERAIAMVDALAQSTDHDAATIAALREELFRVMGCMQFQDITCQQLAHASSVLSDMERRLVDIARLFDPSAFGELVLDASVGAGGSGGVHFDSHASTKNAETRQAVADEVVNDMTDQDRKR
jgi:chemotaxis regulatin CheY-phosphate phosphatase CheZ